MRLWRQQQTEVVHARAGAWSEEGQLKKYCCAFAIRPEMVVSGDVYTREQVEQIAKKLNEGATLQTDGPEGWGGGTIKAGSVTVDYSRELEEGLLFIMCEADKGGVLPEEFRVFADKAEGISIHDAY